MGRGDSRITRSAARGYALPFALLAIALAAAGAASVASTWADDLGRDKEAELLRVGNLYARAIAAYRRNSPGSEKRYPPDLESLLEDRRLVTMTRYLRDLYADPVTGGRDWGLVRGPDGGIRGVYSRSSRVPWRRAAVTLEDCSLPPAQRYEDWKFMGSDT